MRKHVLLEVHLAYSYSHAWMLFGGSTTIGCHQVFDLWKEELQKC